MRFSDVIKKSFIEGFSNADISTADMVVTLGITFLIGMYIFFIYKLVSRSSLYDKSFHVSMALISVITAGIILAMQSSIVISLGMVGALSIVRFRTAIKNPMDLLFLFWSMGVGIICGAGLFEIALLVSLMTTAGIVILEFFPGNRRVYLLVINGGIDLNEDEVMSCVRQYAKRVCVKSRNLKQGGTDLLMEVDTKKEKELIYALRELQEVVKLSLLQHDGEVRF